LNIFDYVDLIDIGTRIRVRFRPECKHLMFDARYAVEAIMLAHGLNESRKDFRHVLPENRADAG
jgi:hypothetical protein